MYIGNTGLENMWIILTETFNYMKIHTQRLLNVKLSKLLIFIFCYLLQPSLGNGFLGAKKLDIFNFHMLKN